MVDIPRVRLPRRATSSERRRRRLERELRVLTAMRGHLQTREIVWAILSIVGVAVLCLLVAAKLRWLGGSLPLALVGAVAAGVVVWLIGRDWFTLAAVIVIGILIIVFEDVPFDGWGSGSTDRKENRRLKLERAIAKREALLRAMQGGRSTP